MGLESATYISQLQPLNPDGADDINQGDNHIRMVKFVLQSQFSGFNTAAPVTASITEMNTLVGVTSSIQTQLNAKAPINSPSFTGTPLTPTPGGGTPTQVANVSYVDAKVATAGTLGDLTDTSVNSSGTSVVNTREFVDTTLGQITRTLPASPATWAIIAYKDAKSTFATNKLIIQPATGQRIENSAVDEVMNVTDNFAYFALKWDGAAWRIL